MVGRQEEIRELQERYAGSEAEFIAIYGRRRVGKTYLVDETFKGKITFRHAGLSPAEFGGNNLMAAQLDHFYQSLILCGAAPNHCPQDWLEAFFMLECDCEPLFFEDIPKRTEELKEWISWREEDENVVLDDADCLRKCKLLDSGPSD